MSQDQDGLEQQRKLAASHGTRGSQGRNLGTNSGPFGSIEQSPQKREALNHNTEQRSSLEGHSTQKKSDNYNFLGGVREMDDESMSQPSGFKPS